MTARHRHGCLTCLLCVCCLFAACGESRDERYSVCDVYPRYFERRGASELRASEFAREAVRAAPDIDARAAWLTGYLRVLVDADAELERRGRIEPLPAGAREAWIPSRRQKSEESCRFFLGDAFLWRTRALRDPGLARWSPPGRPFLEFGWPALDYVRVIETAYARDWARAVARLRRVRVAARRDAGIAAELAGGNRAQVVRKAELSSMQRIRELEAALATWTGRLLAATGGRVSDTFVPDHLAEGFMGAGYAACPGYFEEVSGRPWIVGSPGARYLLSSVARALDAVHARAPGLRVDGLPPTRARSLAEALGTVIVVDDRPEGLVAALAAAGFVASGERYRYPAEPLLPAIELFKASERRFLLEFRLAQAEARARDRLLDGATGSLRAYHERELALEREIDAQRSLFDLLVETSVLGLPEGREPALDPDR